MRLNGLMLFLVASMHDDVAIVMAGFFVLEHGMSSVYAFTAVCIGTVANNCSIYGLGMAARRLPGLKKWLIGDGVEQVRLRFKRRLAPTMILCRFIPGSLSALLLGCGWLGVPFTRFAFITTVTAALYVSFVGALVLILGETILQRLMDEAWPILLALAATVVLIAALKRMSAIFSRFGSRNTAR